MHAVEIHWINDHGFETSIVVEFWGSQRGNPHDIGDALNFIKWNMNIPNIWERFTKIYYVF